MYKWNSINAGTVTRLKRLSAVLVQNVVQFKRFNAVKTRMKEAVHYVAGRKLDFTLTVALNIDQFKNNNKICF